MRALLIGVAALGLGIAATIPGARPVAADVNDFSYDSWHVDYRVSTDERGRATARVTETIVARFPSTDQNRGIVRGLPIDYENASTDPRDFTVTDENGDPVPFETEESDGFVAVLTGDDSYVHGRQSYVISYTLSDTILARDDGAADEFYWDIMDFEHRQPVESFSADIEFSSTLASKLNGDARCYAGAAHSTAECRLTDRDGGVTVPPMSLEAYQGVTVAVGLAPGSVAQPSARESNFMRDQGALVLGPLGAATGIAGLIAASAMKRKRGRARGTIVAQYDVPAEMPPLIAGPIVGSRESRPSAEFVHLAVNGAIRIEEGTEATGLFGLGKPQPVLRLVDPGRAADPLDLATVQLLFPQGSPGDAFTLPHKSESFAKQMTGLTNEGAEDAIRRGYLEKAVSPVARWLGIVTIALALIVLGLGVWGFLVGTGGPPVVAFVAAAVLLVLGISAASRRRVHTRAGAEWREYLEGVREFIRVAEEDRLNMLQSYAGAERRADGQVDVVHLYEKLLPYAMLFGMQKDWVRVLQTRYEQSDGYSPVWYPAAAMHGIGDFEGTISRFTSSLNSSVSYSSSSSGGSSGGGFAGGGGGGGFSGGR